MVTSLLLKPLKQCLINITLFSPLKLHHSQSIPFKCTNNLLVFFQIIWIIQCMRQNSQYTSALSVSLCLSVSLFFPPVLCFKTYHFIFSFSAQNLPFVQPCSHVITQLVSPNCRSRKIEGNFAYKAKYLWDLHSCETLCSTN